MNLVFPVFFSAGAVKQPGWAQPGVQSQEAESSKRLGRMYLHEAISFGNEARDERKRLPATASNIQEHLESDLERSA